MSKPDQVALVMTSDLRRLIHLAEQAIRKYPKNSVYRDAIKAAKFDLKCLYLTGAE